MSQAGPAGDGLTEEEAAQYDRQIRLWGVAAQQKLSKCKVLLANFTPLLGEVCKNIVLSGVGHVTIQDDRSVRLEDLGAHFLLREEDTGANCAEAAIKWAKELNPMVSITAESRSLSDLPDEYFKDFSVVCLGRCTLETQKRINRVCHMNGIYFYSTDSHGFLGYILIDLGVHQFKEEKQGGNDGSSSKPQKDEPQIHTVRYNALDDILEVPWNKLQDVSPIYFAFRVVLEFQTRHGRFPTGQNSESCQQDSELLDGIEKELLSKYQGANTCIQQPIIQSIRNFQGAEISPVCAVIGGTLAQEIIKVVTQKDAPLDNIFTYNGYNGTALVDRIAKAN